MVKTFYLGDGAYVEFDDTKYATLYTGNSSQRIYAINKVFLDAHAVNKFIEKWREINAWKLTPKDNRHYISEYLGKRVRVVMNREDKRAVAVGKLLSFSEDGHFVIVGDDGVQSWCWPALEIYLIGEDEK